MIDENYCLGAGHYLELVLSEIDTTNNTIVAIVDNDINKQSKIQYGFEIISAEQLTRIDYDYIVITIKDYSIIKKQCLVLGINEKKVLPYWEKTDNVFIQRAYSAEHHFEYERVLECRIDSLPYEIGAKIVPRIYTPVNLLIKIKIENNSLARFGDGEFEIILGNNRPWFQNYNKELSKRLMEVLQSDKKEIAIAISQNFILDRKHSFMSTTN